MRHLHHLLPVLAGLAAALGQAPWELWWLALPAYVVGIYSITVARWPFLAGLLFGMAHFALALNWIIEPFLVDAALTGWLAPFALLGFSLGFGLFWAVAGWLGMRLSGGPIGVGVALAGAELLRSYVLTGFPWGLPGHILIGSPALTASAYVGAHGLGLMVLLGAALIAARTPVRMASGVAIWLLPFGLALTLPDAPAVPDDAPVIRLVQPNAPQSQKWDPDFIYVFFQRGLAETAAAPLGRAPDAVVWPETSLPQLLRYSDDLRPVIATAAGGKPVVIGAQRYGEDGRPRNSVVMLTGEGGDVAQVQDKFRLVPFGEYLPLKGFFEMFGLGPLAAQLAGGFVPGDGPVLMDLPEIGTVLPLICYETIFPQILRQVDRPKAILNLTNDAWFGANAGPQQHLALARLRSAESGLPLLRAANTGVSAVIDARGNILGSLPLGEAGHLDAALPPALPPTLYIMTGDWAALMVLLLLTAFLLWHRVRNPVALVRNPT
ncbi:MAG: apolipoprotein N-acyltransferase [Jannaschia helgolandensis]|uniref:Apolipoprotein N-acyltransferase n=1 Tax=Jannaschia helgolandensis TaxID=188906 RepID=A0A1H7JCK2_9RHOB|nr:apolipoprotein N-acyltransferase [Jannaschia helgolandensis]SEK71627.1 Apolipoprotein N-acyltransferase [Jannaschia helgolandensis]